MHDLWTRIERKQKSSKDLAPSGFLQDVVGLDEEFHAQAETVRRRVHQLPCDVIAQVEPQLLPLLPDVLEAEVVELYDAQLLTNLQHAI